MFFRFLSCHISLVVLGCLLLLFVLEQWHRTTIDARRRHFFLELGHPSGSIFLFCALAFELALQRAHFFCPSVCSRLAFLYHHLYQFSLRRCNVKTSSCFQLMQKHLQNAKISRPLPDVSELRPRFEAGVTISEAPWCSIPAPHSEDAARASHVKCLVT